MADMAVLSWFFGVGLGKNLFYDNIHKTF